jgi:hypothetical protein
LRLIKLKGVEKFKSNKNRKTKKQNFPPLEHDKTKRGGKIPTK